MSGLDRRFFTCRWISDGSIPPTLCCALNRKERGNRAGAILVRSRTVRNLLGDRVEVQGKIYQALADGGTLVAMAANFGCFAQAQKTISADTGYAVWTGIVGLKGSS